MGQDITPTKHDIFIARAGILSHLKRSGIAKNYDSMAHAMEELNLWEFIENQVMVSAQHAATIRNLYSYLHPEHKFVRLKINYGEEGNSSYELTSNLKSGYLIGKGYRHDTDRD